MPAGVKPGKKKEVDPIFTKKENATVAQRLEILDWYHANGRNQVATAAYWDKKYPNLCLKQPLVSDWVKNEAKWREQGERGGARKAKRARQTAHPELTEMLELWIEGAMRDGIIVTGEVLRQKWRQFADLQGIPETTVGSIG